LTVRGTKLFVTVEIGGKPRRFVVDTGSPSMISSTLVKELWFRHPDECTFVPAILSGFDSPQYQRLR
jgi:hypothetical protein